MTEEIKVIVQSGGSHNILAAIDAYLLDNEINLSSNMLEEIEQYILIPWRSQIEQRQRDIFSEEIADAANDAHASHMSSEYVNGLDKATEIIENAGKEKEG